MSVTSHRLAVLLFATVALTGAYFYQGGGWNQNSRLDLTRAMVEGGTLRIDALHGNTGDKALVRGAYYCDKAPGTSWLALPWYAAARAVGRGLAPGPRLALGAYAATVGAVVLPSAAAAVAVAFLAGVVGVSLGWQVALALAYAFGTLALPYATLFYGHQPAAALLVGAFALLAARRARPLAGLLLGASVTVEYPALLAVLVLLAYAVWRERRPGPLLGLAGGLLVPLALLAAYHAVAFGSPLSLPYDYSTQPHRHAGFFMGLGAPSPAALWGILFSPYRGLFFSAPWLLLAVPGVFVLLRRRETRAEGFVCAGVALLLLWLNASLVDWEGGSALGPRYLVPALPFLAVCAAGVLRPVRPASWAGMAVLAAIAFSVALMLAGTSVQPEVSKEIARPWSEVVWPQLAAGHLAVNRASFDDYLPGKERRAWNLGMRAGLTGLASLLPLLVLWAVAGLAALRLPRPRDAAPG
jgi:hypothetical protein